MDNQTTTDRHYRVVRYHSDFGIGVVEEVLGYHLTKDEAEYLARENPPIVSDEEIAVEDENSAEYGSSTEIDTLS